MSKEQTPIEWLLSKINVDESSWEEIEKYESIAKQKEQKHIQAKVLEALEREQEDLERMYLLGRYERGESDKKMDLIDTSKSVIDELLRKRSKTKV